MTVYLDNDYKCHIQPGEGRIAVITDQFDGICEEVIEGYRMVPAGETWTQEDGTAFAGEMVTPWKDSRELEEIQRKYERQKLAEYKSALKTLGVQTE